MGPCGLAGSGGTEVGAWAGKLSPLLPGCTPWTQSSGAWAVLTAWSSSGVAAQGFPSPQPVHSLTCSMRNPTSSPQVLESSHVLKCPVSASLSTWQHSEMERKVLLRGVYSQELANPGTGSLHGLSLGSPCNPSLKCQILVPGSTELPGEFELFLSESAKVSEKGKLKPAVKQSIDSLLGPSETDIYFLGAHRLN